MEPCHGAQGSMAWSPVQIVPQSFQAEKEEESSLPEGAQTMGQDKPFQCSECWKSFSRSSYLVKHRRTHRLGKPHECTQCGKRFGQRSYLCKHRLIHGAGPAHECMQCGKRFRLRAYLCKHRRTHVP
ncbi:hypothetical protein Y1Q_0004786 [Alligator mississippiensis]|nr:hypothetical protein Y1Q_0004786 [Alligator mississippiensis]